jgi:hypothetical protein
MSEPSEVVAIFHPAIHRRSNVDHGFKGYAVK